MCFWKAKTRSRSRTSGASTGTQHDPAQYRFHGRRTFQRSSSPRMLYRSQPQHHERQQQQHAQDKAVSDLRLLCQNLCRTLAQRSRAVGQVWQPQHETIKTRSVKNKLFIMVVATDIACTLSPSEFKRAGGEEDLNCIGHVALVDNIMLYSVVERWCRRATRR